MSTTVMGESRMPRVERTVSAVIRGLVRLLCRIETNELNKIPARGPAILVSNHSTTLEGPIYYVMLHPRPRTALGKQELWDNPLTRFLMELWGIIPLNRRGADRRAMSRARAALDRGDFLGIAPEGTRSRSGELQRGRPGAAMIATAQRVPIIPMVQWGIQDLRRNLAEMRRTPLHFRVGSPFYLNVPGGGSPGRQDLRLMADEIMYQLAALLPEEFRGYYSDLDRMTTRFIQPVYTGETSI